MSFVQDEYNNTILHGWQMNKSPEEVAEELMKFNNYMKEVNKIFNQKRRNTKRSKKHDKK